MKRRKHVGIASGAVRMAELGKKPIQIWVRPHELAQLKQAAAIEYRTVAGLVKLNAMLAAKEILREAGLP